MTVFVSKADVISANSKGIKTIVFELGCLYLIWEDDTMSQYQYNWIANHSDSKILGKEYMDVIDKKHIEKNQGGKI